MVCVKDEYLIKVPFLKYSGLLDYLVYCFPPGVYRLEVCCVMMKFQVSTVLDAVSGNTRYSFEIGKVDTARYFSLYFSVIIPPLNITDAG
jgi:hypothetical protein